MKKATILVIIIVSIVLIGIIIYLSLPQGLNAPLQTVEVASDDLNAYIQLPQGFSITLYADNIPGARSLARSPSGTLFVGTRDRGNVYALKDTNNDFVADEQSTIVSGLNSPNGVAFKDNALYVAEINRILRFDSIEQNLQNPSYTVVTDDYPTDGHHGWKFIRFGPDGRLYVPVGAPCNICESEEIYASITALNITSGEHEVIAHGVRNTVGFDFNPATQELWFTDNGRDWLGNEFPADELNHLTQNGQHFGFPFCHQGDIQDTEFKDKTCNDFTQPARKLGPHVAALGMRFYTGTQFPEHYHNGIFIAEHGSWNRDDPIGYRIMFVPLNNNQAQGYEVFASGWLTPEENVIGRPVDLEVLPDGSLLVSDDHAGKIYRITYAGN